MKEVKSCSERYMCVFMKESEQGGVGPALPAVINSPGWLCNSDAAVCRSAAQGEAAIG